MLRRPIYRDLWLWLILLMALTLRVYHLAYPAWDYHNWRQTITLMVARDFARHGFPLLHPQVSWIRGDQPSAPSYFSAEFSVQSILAAVLYRWFGESDAIARLVVIAFSLLGIAALYDLLYRRAGPLAARLGAFIYAVVPYHIFFGRVFMPDIPAVSLTLAGLDLLDRWTDERTPGRLAGAAALTALAILQKLTVIFAVLPVVYLFRLTLGPSWWKRREPFLFGLVAGAPALAWYAYAISLAHQSAFTMQRDLFLHHLELWFQPAYVLDVFRALALEAFSPLVLGLALIGCFWPAGGRASSLFRLWVAGAGGLLILMPGVLPSNHYYLSLLLPGGAALAGLALARMAAIRVVYYLLPVILGVLAAGAIRAALPLYDSDRAPYHLGILLNRLTKPGDLLVTESGGNPNVLYAADRRGWMLFRELSGARLEGLKQAGALYYADTFLADPKEHAPFFGELDQRFGRLTTDDGPWPIYTLAVPPRIPAAALPQARRLQVGDGIEFRGLGVRTLLDWPASFEFTYYWHCLKSPANDVRASLHITDSTGRTAYQQDHRPLWKTGEDFAERSVVVLPPSLPAGRYQVRLGPVNPGPDPAAVAEIEVRRPPRFGWFGLD
jgi:4-amino-4-deoxy-L-arabinose transferase-like glycosyltransferase